jgi:hypothetical protein
MPVAQIAHELGFAIRPISAAFPTPAAHAARLVPGTGELSQPRPGLECGSQFHCRRAERRRKSKVVSGTPSKRPHRSRALIPRILIVENDPHGRWLPPSRRDDLAEASPEWRDSRSSKTAAIARQR